MNDAIDAETLALIEEAAPVADEATKDDQPEADVDLEDQVGENDEDDDVADTSDEEAYDDEEDDGDTDPAEDEGQPEPLHTVTVDGVEIQVTTDELRRGYSGQQYIQQGMREVAEARKQVQAMAQNLQTELAQIDGLRQRLANPIQPPKAPDTALAQSDPIGYMQQRAQYESQLAEYQQQQQAFVAVQQRQAAFSAAQHEQMLQQQVARLKEAVPEFADPETAKKLREALIDVGSRDYGFSPDELSQIVDARQIRILHDAYKWRQQQKARSEAKAKTAAAPKVMKAGPKPAQNASKKAKTQQAKARMAKTGNIDDVANFLLS